MKRVTIKQYIAANSGDYDEYKLSNGESFSMWFKHPFRKSNIAHVHIVTGEDREVGIAILIKNIDSLTIHLNASKIVVDITMNQFLKPNKKYYFDKIIKHLLISKEPINF